MMLSMYAMRDRATDQFAQPMFLVNHGQAIRSFGDEINRAGTEAQPNYIFMHPDDFDLYFLGTYDTSSGSFVAVSPEQIAIGKNLKR